MEEREACPMVRGASFRGSTFSYVYSLGGTGSAQHSGLGQCRAGTSPETKCQKQQICINVYGVAMSNSRYLSIENIRFLAFVNTKIEDSIFGR